MKSGIYKIKAKIYGEIVEYIAVVQGNGQHWQLKAGDYCGNVCENGGRNKEILGKEFLGKDNLINE